MRVLLVYPNLRGMNMLPPAIALYSSLLKEHGHVVDLFDSTSWALTDEADWDSDKQKERSLNARPFDDSLLRKNDKDGDVFQAFLEKVEAFSPDLLAVSTSEDLFPVSIRLLKAVRRSENSDNPRRCFSNLCPGPLPNL